MSLKQMLRRRKAETSADNGVPSVRAFLELSRARSELIEPSVVRERVVQDAVGALRERLANL